jgi:hypothetical protein
MAVVPDRARKIAASEALTPGKFPGRFLLTIDGCCCHVVGQVHQPSARQEIGMLFQRIFATVLVVGILVPSPNGADDDQAQGIVDKAIAAVGGKEKLRKYQASTFADKGTYYGMGQGLPYTGKYAVQWPDQFRMEIENVFVIVVTKDKGWLRTDQGTIEMTADQFSEQKENLYASWVLSLLPLTEKGFRLSVMDEITVNDRPCASVKVSKEGHRDVKLYFDKKTGLMAKSIIREKAEELGGKEVDSETVYEDYRDVGGIKTAHKLTMKREGKLFVESQVTEVKYHEKLGDEVFAKP